jgi:hypothetical protein
VPLVLENPPLGAEVVYLLVEEMPEMQPAPARHRAGFQ